MVKYNIDIQQIFLTDEIKKHIIDGFHTYSVQQMGYDGRDSNQIAFTAYDGYQFIGVASVVHFWNTLWIKYVFVNENYRNHGIGQKLVKRALEYANLLKCKFAFAETMSFQAPEFYRKMGFRLEFTRNGFADGTSLHYFKKMLDQRSIIY